MEKLCHCKLTKSDIEYYIQKLDSDIYDKTINLTSAEFNDLNTDFDNVHELYNSKIIKNPKCLRKEVVYEKISTTFGMFATFANQSVLIIDNFLSGIYEIIHNDVLSILIYNNDDQEIYNKFKKIVLSFTSSEIRSFLYTIGSTLSLDKKYYILFTDNNNIGVYITVCSKSIMINKKLVNDPNNLKLYLLDYKRIFDQTILPQLLDSNLELNEIIESNEFIEPIPMGLYIIESMNIGDINNFPRRYIYQPFNVDTNLEIIVSHIPDKKIKQNKQQIKQHKIKIKIKNYRTEKYLKSKTFPNIFKQNILHQGSNVY